MVLPTHQPQLTPAAKWAANLHLRYERSGDTTKASWQHDGPVRVLKSLYPEGLSICHNVIVHPPGGLVGGDDMRIGVHVGPNAHGLVSTPGATRFYASDNDSASQSIAIQLDEHARLEWMPLEAIAYPGCKAINQWHANLAPSAHVIAWDVVGLGLPHANMPFTNGHFRQRLAIDGCWLEAGLLDGQDALLMDGVLGLNGHRCSGTLWWAHGSPMTALQQSACVQSCRDALAVWAPDIPCAVTAPNDHMVVVRALGATVEPVMQRLQTVWPALRRAAWDIDAPIPRIWQV